eukprot:CAMPEP_0113955492 /NCGR_PEP_ID=MMETSP0011_2-20120614/1376_1 /TAXON_ID=101924 /ORGANISM="Rhodosorus marinus" /LENGTH=109 /DNA_ID=CAMNT_0000965213 /DNA_START=589 /DNA_END=918 /DNA_ORIENTATION=+ /assembly_acc=CAM_ASM_000156
MTSVQPPGIPALRLRIHTPRSKRLHQPGSQEALPAATTTSALATHSRNAHTDHENQMGKVQSLIARAKTEAEAMQKLHRQQEVDHAALKELEGMTKRPGSQLWASIGQI